MAAPKININKEIIALFSGQSNIVTTPKLYIQLTGSHSLAIVLNQCAYWSNKSTSKDGWFYKQYEEWFEEIHIPERTLRRRFNTLEKNGWITTKIKKVKGVNTKHIFLNMDTIVESISTMLSTDCPDRPQWPPRPESDQNPCTKVAPTGQSGRSEPAKVADTSIDTEDYVQKKLTNCASSSSFFSQKQKDELLSYKLQSDDRTNELFLEHCTHHVESQQNDLSKYQRFTGLKNILIKQYEIKEKFKATGFGKPSIKAVERTTPPTAEDFENYKKCIPGYEWVTRWRQQQA